MKKLHFAEPETNEMESNAELIADTFNTYNETPILPSELLKQRNELLEALKEAKECLEERLRIDYTSTGADDETANRLASIDIKNFLLFKAIKNANQK
jgi:hypothetical protein